MNARRTCLVAYDIRDERRLVRVHRAMTRRGHALQYSVFAADFTPDEKAEALAALAALVDPRVDDVRVYPVPAALFGAWLGSPLSSSLVMSTEPAATLADRLARRPFWKPRQDE